MDSLGTASLAASDRPITRTPTDDSEAAAARRASDAAVTNTASAATRRAGRCGPSLHPAGGAAIRAGAPGMVEEIAFLDSIETGRLQSPALRAEVAACQTRSSSVR